MNPVSEDEAPTSRNAMNILRITPLPGLVDLLCLYLVHECVIPVKRMAVVNILLKVNAGTNWRFPSNLEQHGKKWNCSPLQLKPKHVLVQIQNERRIIEWRNWKPMHQSNIPALVPDLEDSFLLLRGYTTRRKGLQLLSCHLWDEIRAPMLYYLLNTWEEWRVSQDSWFQRKTEHQEAFGAELPLQRSIAWQKSRYRGISDKPSAMRPDSTQLSLRKWKYQIGSLTAVRRRTLPSRPRGDQWHRRTWVMDKSTKMAMRPTFKDIFDWIDIGIDDSNLN